MSHLTTMKKPGYLTKDIMKRNFEVIEVYRFAIHFCFSLLGPPSRILSKQFLNIISQNSMFELIFLRIRVSKLIIYKTLPEAQRTQGIASKT